MWPFREGETDPENKGVTSGIPELESNERGLLRPGSFTARS